MTHRRTVIVLQHAVPETLGTIEEALLHRGLAPSYIRVFAGEPVPNILGDAAGLIVMGGPMSVYEQDKYSHLREELRLIESALKDDRPVLGVCLGSQLLAATLGAPVSAGKQKEIGWHAIRFTAHAMDDLLCREIAASKSRAPESLMAFHWHGDVFPLPQGAVHLASSELTPVQMFRYGEHAYGFLCHFEVDGHIIAKMQSAFSEELRQVGIATGQMDRESQRYLAGLQNMAKMLWERWAGIAADPKNKPAEGGEPQRI